MQTQPPPARNHVRPRPAVPADIPAIAAIYGHHVRHGTASFETEPPGEAEMRRRMAEVAARGLPYLVAEDPADGSVLGYAYATPWRARPAYRHSVENSVYLRPAAMGRGLGRILLEALVEACTALGRRRMVAVVGDSANAASVRLHQACGFRLVGTLHAVGRKHGRWLDTVLLERALGEGDATPPGDERDGG